MGIVVPALNEVHSITSVIRSAREFGTPIVVDDGSNDGTGELAKSLGAEVIQHRAPLGYDSALNSGFSYAEKRGFQSIITIDGDGQHNSASLIEFQNQLVSGVDMIIGIRDKLPRISESLFALSTRIRWGICDPLCGMKGYQMSLYRQLGYFDSYGSIGTELMLFAVRQGFQVTQVPIIVTPRSDQPRLGSKFDANRKIARAMLLSYCYGRKPRRML